MSKEQTNRILESFIKDNISPTTQERKKIKDEYDFISSELGRTFQSGSYARFTAIHPVNDLDIIYIISEEKGKKILSSTREYSQIKADNILEELKIKIDNFYKERGVKVDLKVQSHSIGIYFGTDEDFSIDIVPAIELQKINKYHKKVILVPELIKIPKQKRQLAYQRGGIKWIKSDPRYYIEKSIELNTNSEAFRKATKFLKHWKRMEKKKTEDFFLKSFHIEVIMMQYFEKNSEALCIDGILHFLNNVEQYLAMPQFQDAADLQKYIDEYLREPNNSNKEIYILQPAKKLLNTLERIIKLSKDEDIKECIKEIFEDKKESTTPTKPHLKVC